MPLKTLGQQDPFELEPVKKRDRSKAAPADLSGLNFADLVAEPEPPSALESAPLEATQEIDQELSFDSEQDRIAFLGEQLEKDKQQRAREADAQDMTEVGKGFRAGTAETLGLFGAAKAAAGSLIGDDEMFASGMQYYQDKMKEAEAFAGDVDELEEIDLFDEGGIGRAGDYLAYTFGRVLPSILTSVAGGGVTGVAGLAAGKLIAKESAEGFAKELVEKKVKDQAEQEANEFLAAAIREDLESTLAKEAGKRYADNVARRTAQKAGIAGSYLTSTTLNTGETFAKIYEREGVEAPGTALAAGMISGALDTFATPSRVIKKAFPDKFDAYKKELSDQLADESYGKIAKDVLGDALDTGSIEAGTEAAQEIISDLAADFVNRNFTENEKVQYLNILTTEEGRSRIYNAAAAGAIGGFSVGGVASGAREGLDARQRSQSLAQEQEKRLQRMEQYREDAAQNLEEKKSAVDKPMVGPMPRRVGFDIEFEGDLSPSDTPVFERINQINQRSGTETNQVEGDDTFQSESFGGSAKLVNQLQNTAGPQVSGVVLPSVGETFPSDQINDNQGSALISNIYLDLVDRGMPVEFLDGVSGFHIFDSSHNLDENAEAASFPVSKTIAFSKEIVDQAIDDPQLAKRLAANFAHEAWHQADNQNLYSENLPDLEMTRLDPEGGIFNVRFGAVVDEIFINWEQGTETGKKFGYPLNDFYDALTTAKNAEEQDKIIRTTKREIFAQLGSAFLAAPGKLKRDAPLAYSLIRSIRDNPSGVFTEAQDVDTTDQTIAETTSAPAVLPDVRAPPVEGSTEVLDGDGVGVDGTTGPGQERAGEQLGEQAPVEDGDVAGRLLPQQQRILDVINTDQGLTPTDIATAIDEDLDTVTVLLDQLEADNQVQTELNEDGPLYFTEDTPELAKRPEDGPTVADLSARREIENLKKFNAELQDSVESRVQQKIELIQAAQSDGFFGPFKRGMRYITSQDRDGETVSFRTEVKGLTMSKVGPLMRSGKYSRFGPIPEEAIFVGPDGKDYYAGLYTDTIGPDGLKSQGVSAVWVLEKQLQSERLQFMGDLQSAEQIDETPELVRVPSPEEDAPVLPMGKVEESVKALLDRTDKNPTSRQLRNLTGSPSPRKDKAKLDKNVRPRTLEDLRGFMSESLEGGQGLEWYDQFGQFFRGLVGDANLDEASVVFGITSAQNSAEQNLADTLHIMSLARKTNPAENPKQFALAVKNTPRPGGQRLKITGRQIDTIVDFYTKGEMAGGIKTTTYMQMVGDRGRNLFNPFSVQDVHMARVFGFNYRDVDKKSGEVVDTAKFPSENAYRYGQYLTSVLAEEFGVTPNQAQALLWFYAKTNLSPQKGGKPGTFESAESESQAEIEVIRQQIADGTFDTESAVTAALEEGVTPRNIPATQEGFSNVDEKEQLVELAAARAPKLIASAIPGVDRGFAFAEGTTIEQMIEYNDAVVEAITDDDGQIPYLRALNLPHEIERSSGSFTGFEPSITIRLLGSNFAKANELAPLLGDALLQDSVLTFQPAFKSIGLSSFIVRKNDGSDFTIEQGQRIAEILNPAKDPGGLNFNQPLNNTLMFLDSQAFEVPEYTDGMSKDFYAKLSEALGAVSEELDTELSIGIVPQNSEYFDHNGYQEAIERSRDSYSPERRSDLQNIARDTLYEPTKRVYDEYAKRYGLREESVDPGTPSPPARADVGINVRTDGALNYAQLIVSGEKKFESRIGNSLRPYVGKRVGIIETGSGPAKLVGFATVGEPTQVNAKEFAEMRDQHLVPEGSRFDIQPGQTKLLYEMIDPQPLAEPVDASGTKGIVARDISQLPSEPTPDESGEFIKRTFDGSTPSASYNLKDQAVVVNDLQRMLEQKAPFYKGLVDRYMNFKELERRIAANMGMDKLPAGMSFYDQENLMHGKVADDLANLEKDYIEPIAKLAEAAGVNAEAVGLYLLAKHAPERNAVIAEKNRKLREKQVADAEKADDQAGLQIYAETPIPFQDGGSGITNAQAEGILAQAEKDGLTTQMEEIAGKVYQMLDEFRQRMVDQRLLDEDSKLDWESTYQFYVPLKGFAAEPDEQGNYQSSDKTRGFSITGSESLKAMGRKSLPQNPLLVSFMDVEAKMVRGRKNEVANTLYDLLREADKAVGHNPSQGPSGIKHNAWTIWTTRNRPTDRDDPNKKMTLQAMKRATRTVKDFKNKEVTHPRFMQVKRGGQTYFIEFSDVHLNATVHKLGEQELSGLKGLVGTAAKTLGGFQNLRRNFLINYNPTFMLTNPIRDVEASIVYLLGEADAPGSRTQGENIAMKVAKGTPAAARAYLRHAGRKEGKSEAAKELDQYTKEYFEDGAPTGLTLTRSYDEQISRLNSLVGRGKIKQAILGMGEVVELANQASENMIRLSTYVEARKAGTPRADAATLAKDITVNFNRKGEASETLNLIYLFFNAAIQGNTNIFQAIGRKGVKAKAAALGMVGIGYALSNMNILLSGEDEDGELNYQDYTESALKRTINILPFEDSTGFALPMAYGYGLFFNIGRYVAELQHGIKDEYEVATAFVQNIVDHFSPLSLAEGDNIAEQSRGLAPDVAELVIDQAVNKNFFGSPIQYEQLPMGPKKADSFASKKATNENLKMIYEWLYEATGGNEFMSSEDARKPRFSIDWSPDRMDYTLSYLFGGLGRFVGDVSDVVTKLVLDPEDITTDNVPIASAFYKKPSEYTDRMEFYKNAQTMKNVIAQAKFEAVKGEDEIASFLEVEQPLIDLETDFRVINEQLNAYREVRKFVERNNQDVAAVRKRKDEIEEEQNLLFDGFNKKFRAALEKRNQN